MSLREIIYDLGGGIAGRPRAEGGRPGRLVDGDPDEGRDRRRLRLRLARAARARRWARRGIVVLDDRCCIVQLGIRFSEFYEHESCGKCTPCREGTRWLTAILRKLEDGRATQARPRPAARRLRPDQRQVPLPARRLRRDHRRQLRREVPRRVRRAHRAGRLPVRRRVVARPRPGPDPDARAFAGAEARGRAMARPRHRHDRRAHGAGAEGHRHGRDRAAAGIEIPVFCYEPRLGAAGRRLPHVPRRGARGCRSCRPAAR